MDISLIDASTDIKISPSKTPDFINSYFANIGKDLAKDFKDDWVPLSPPFNETELSEISTDFEEVHPLCKEINTSKSSAVDMLASRILKDAFLVLTLQLVYMFNISLSNGIFPPKLKDYMIGNIVTIINRELLVLRLTKL